MVPGGKDNVEISDEVKRFVFSDGQILYYVVLEGGDTTLNISIFSKI